MQISENGLGLIRRFEGCRLRAYPDPGSGAEPWTIGYGWTRPVDGKQVKPGMEISQATADRLLRCGVVSYEQTVSRTVKVRLTQNQFDALVSLCYNIGPKSFTTSTLLRLLNQGDYAAAAAQFQRWVAPNNPAVTEGLRRRRTAERELFLRPA